MQNSRIMALVLGGFVAGSAAAAQSMPPELRQDTNHFNLQSTNGVPISTTPGDPPGSDGNAPATASRSQFQSVVVFGAVAAPGKHTLASGSLSYAANAGPDNLDLPRAMDGHNVKFVLTSARVGAPFLGRLSSFRFGETIPVPDTDEYGVPLSISNPNNFTPERPAQPPEDYWLSEPYTTDNHANTAYYWSPYAGVVFAIQSGPVDITWRKTVPAASDPNPPSDYDASKYWKDAAGNYYPLYKQHYLVSGSPIKTPRKIYWTEGDFNATGKPVTVPAAQVGDINIVYNHNFPKDVPDEEVYAGLSQTSPTDGTDKEPLKEHRTLWYEKMGGMGSLHAYNKEGRVFVEILGDTRPDGNRQHLGFEIVDVIQQCNPAEVTVDLGERLTAYPGGKTPPANAPEAAESALYPEPILKMGQTFIFQHNTPGNDRSDLYATYVTQNLNDVQVWWLEAGLEGLKWPYRLVRYRQVWPDDVGKYVHYVRPRVETEEEAKATAVPLPNANAPYIECQDFFDPQHCAKLTETFAFYVWLTPEYPAHRTLLRFVSGEYVAFERVFSWLDQSLLDMQPTIVPPNLVAQVIDGQPGFNQLKQAAGMFLDGPILYVASVDDDALSIIDVSDPAHPRLLKELKDEQDGFNALDGAIGVFVSNSIAYVTAAFDDALTIIDVTDPASPVLLKVIKDGEADYHALNEAKGIFVSGTVAYVTATADNAFTIIDVSNPKVPVLLKELIDTQAGFSGLKGAFSIYVSGDIAYLTATNGTLMILNVSDPSNPVLVKELRDGVDGFDQLAGARSVFVSDSIAYITSFADNALTLVDVHDPASPKKLAEITDGIDGFDALAGAALVYVAGPTVYVTSYYDNSLTIIDTSDPAHPRRLTVLKQGEGDYQALAGAWGIQVSDRYAYISGRLSDALTIIDLAPLMQKHWTANNLADTVASELSAYHPGTQTFYWTNSLQAPRVVNLTATVGERLIAPVGESGNLPDADYLAGYINPNKGTYYNPNAYVDPFIEGFEAANQGTIIPVNAIDGQSIIEVWWFRANEADLAKGFSPVYWPSVIGCYTLEWPPDNPDNEIVLASNNGSGPLVSLQAKGRIYVQNDTNAPGYNPNEEHALMQGGQVYALRDDLNITKGDATSSPPYSSAPYVLLEYAEADGRPAMRAFKVLREKPDANPPIVFDYQVEAGTILQPPMPLPLLEKPLKGTKRQSLNKEILYWHVLSNSAYDAKTGLCTLTTQERHFFESFTELMVRVRNATQSSEEVRWFYPFEVDQAASTLSGVVSTRKPFNLGSAVQEQESPWSAYITIIGYSNLPSEAKDLKQGDEMVLVAPSLQKRSLAFIADIGSINIRLEFYEEWTADDLKEARLLLKPDSSLAQDQLRDWCLGSETQFEEAPTISDLYASFTLQDRNHNIWTYRGPHESTDRPLVMRFYYKTLPGFFFPELEGQPQPPVGTITPYLTKGNQDGTSSDNKIYGDKNNDQIGDDNALEILYRPVWPADVPVLQMGETLTLPKRGLPAVRGQTSVEIVYQQSQITHSSNPNSVVLHDPTREKVFELDAPDKSDKLNAIPQSVRTQMYRGKTYFPDLPPHLAERFFLDPNRGTNGALVFRGEFVDAPMGDDYLLLNVLGQKDLTELKGLCEGFGTDKTQWDAAIDSLTTDLELFVENPAKPGTFVPFSTAEVGPSELAEITNDDVAVDSYALTAVGPGIGYVTFIVGNGLAFTPPEEPVTVYILKVVDSLYRGEVNVVESCNPLNEKLTLQQVVDLAGQTHLYDFEWKIAAPVDGLPPAVYQNTPTNLLSSGLWGHVRFPLATDKPDNIDTIRPTRISSDTDTTEFPTVIAVSGIPFATITTNDGKCYFGFESTSRKHALVTGNQVVLRDVNGLEVYGTVDVRTTDEDLVVTIDSGQGNVPEVLEVRELYERVVSKQPQSIVFRSFEMQSVEYYSRFYLSLELDSALGAIVYLDGQPVITANRGSEDTPTTSAPAGLSALSRVYRLGSAPLAGGTRNADGTVQHRVAVALFSQALPNIAQTFNLKLGAYVSVDVTEDQWLPLDPEKYADGIRAVIGGAGDVRALSDNYLIMRYQANDSSHASWISSPADADENIAWSQWTEPQLAEGWIKRVLKGINPFNQRVTDLFNNQVNTTVSILAQAGSRWEGDVALNLDTINDAGLIEIYETVLNRGKKLSINAGINYGPANDALLLAAGYLNDLYMMLGNEGWADAANPTIGIGTKDQTYGDIATALFSFKGQLASVLEEELALLRGRDDFLLPGVELRPVYNRLVWNYTRGIDAGEVIYALNYNILDQDFNGVVDADDARQLYPQGHGDAYGHYLTALKGYYALLLDNDFDWVPRIEAVTVLGKPVSVDYLDERKFAAAAAAVARASKQIFDLTWRRDYQSGPGKGWEHFAATRDNTARASGPSTRYWGLDHWASRVGQGAYVNWAVANAILPDVDPDPNHEGIQKVDRTTVPELQELPTLADSLQTAMDNAEGGMTPLGLPETTIPFDLDPIAIVGGNNTTHFEQVYQRAKVALQNALVAFDDAKDVTRLMRSEEDSLADFRATVDQQELAYTNSLIELYGTPYPDDIGPGQTYRTGYEGPDLLHYVYVDSAELTFPGMLDPQSNVTWKVDLQTFPLSWLNENGWSDFNFITKAREGDVDGTSVLESYTEKHLYVEYNLASHGFFEKPSDWTGQRASPGRIQQAISDIIKARNAAYEAFYRADSAKTDLDWAIVALENRIDSHKKIRDWKLELAAIEELFDVTKAGFDIWTKVMDQTKTQISSISSLAAASLPTVMIAGLAAGGDLTAPLRGILKGTGVAFESVHNWSQIIAYIGIRTSELLNNLNKRLVENFAIAPEEWNQELRDAMNDLRNKVYAVQNLLPTINQRLQELDDAQRTLRSLVAEGERIQAEREIFRQRAAAVIQGYRTRDAAFRIFRNEKLERYKTLFDLAARYAFLAAKAYDYETGLLHTDPGQAFINRIVNSRALGVVKNGEPQFAGSSTGDPGLSSALAEMYADWLVLKGRLGFNNPDAYGTTVSLRTEQFRILPTTEGNDNWKDVLNLGRMDNVLEDSDVRRYCLQIDPGNDQAVPGIVLEFSTMIADSLNLFGRPLAAGDHAFSPSSFATKIFAVGVALEGYRGMDNPVANSGAVNGAGGTSPSDPNVWYLDPLALAATPYVYLIPVGVDSMRSPPLGDASVVRTWSVDDVTIPLPFNISASEFSTTPLWQSSESLSEPLFSVRKHQAFRPVSTASAFSLDIYGSNGQLKPSQFTNKRLIGRSVWNSKWKLVIPGRTLLSFPEEGLDRFIQTVTDIKLHLVTYSYAGN